MLKKLIVIVLFIISSAFAQDISIFFLKDGSIVQGQVVNENQNRIFLKTDQGTIKIKPSDILGREDAAKQGDLTFISERLEYLQGNVNHLTGQVNHWNDSLKYALNDLYELFRDLEVLQNEFEIDLLRLHSQGREQKKKIEYVQDDLVNQRVNIASNRQEMGGIDDTVNTMNKQFTQVRQKLDITANQSYLLSGNLSSIKKDLESIRSVQNNQQNQIDMMSGALANNIQEVIRVQGKFGDVEQGVESNQIEIKKLNNNLELKTDELAMSINSSKKDLTESLDIISTKLDEMDINAVKARKKLATDIGDLKNELEIVNDKVIILSRDLRKNEEQLSSISDKVVKVESSIKKVDTRLSKLKTKVDEIPISAPSES
tara:strand:+ start:1632 stop:2750 length:1119 start_codon:yes stop_codon:yes gene_type:complete